MPPSDPDPCALTIEAPDPAARKLAGAFLWLGVGALVGSGLLAIVLVVARTPGISRWLAIPDIFRAALVVHVDLSVLIWFMAFACVLWSFASAPRWLAMGWGSWGLAAAGTLAMTVSPFLPGARPLLNNYIPVLQQPVFLAGLATCGLGFGLAVLRTLATCWRADARPGGQALRAGIAAGAVAGAATWIALAASLHGMPAMEGVAYYEALFWGPGHILQFQHALLATVAWLWLAENAQARPPWTPAVISLLFGVAALPLLAVAPLYVAWPPGTAGHVVAFARLMEWGHLLMLPLLAGVAICLPRVVKNPPSPEKSALLASLVLFATGGLLAFLIRGANVVVPAHYHGSIVGVTIAFMGLAYTLLPQLGFRTAPHRLATWQPWVYGGGQFMHIIGLAWSGGYGVQRKVAGSEQVLATLPEKIGMGMMGLGGLIAIVGGIMFVVACLRAMWPAGSDGSESRAS